MLSLLYHRGESFIDVGAAITGGPQSAVRIPESLP